MNKINDQFTIDRIVTELKRLDWTKGLNEEAIDEIAKTGEWVQFNEGSFIQHAYESQDSLFFIFYGRLSVTTKDIFGKILFERFMMKGAICGLFSLAQQNQVADVVATEHSSGIRIKTDKLIALMVKYPKLLVNIFGIVANQSKQTIVLDRKKNQPSTVGIIHQTSASRLLTPCLVRRLVQVENTLCVVSDDPNWQPIENVHFRMIHKADRLFSSAEQRQALLKEWAGLGRTFIDIDIDHNIDHLLHVFHHSDMILWCVRPEDINDAIKILNALQEKGSGWRDKTCLVWMLDNKNFVAPYEPRLLNLINQDFKISFSEPDKKQNRLLQYGIERIIHHLRGIQIGLALGGGAARGMAHLGVLKVLEQNGIYVDMIAGTSAGAMIGTCYAFGLDIDYTVNSFITDLRLPWIFRRLPAGSYWYLLYKYRRGLFDPMLRKYLSDTRLEQLLIPMITVTVDLVKGTPVARESGDAVLGILESINLPGFSIPIVRGNKALVDGGLVNNIPADVLVSKGCNFVLASSVTAKLEPEFMGIRADQPHQKYSQPSTLKTIMRGSMVQSFNMNSVGVQPADFVIEPDVTGFDLSEFERTAELAAVGECTTKDTIRIIKQQLHKLDSELFSE